MYQTPLILLKLYRWASIIKTVVKGMLIISSLLGAHIL